MCGRLLLHTGMCTCAHTYLLHTSISLDIYLHLAILLDRHSLDSSKGKFTGKIRPKTEMDKMVKMNKLTDIRSTVTCTSKAPTTCAQTWYQWNCQQSSSTGPRLLCPQEHCKGEGPAQYHNSCRWLRPHPPDLLLGDCQDVLQCLAEGPDDDSGVHLLLQERLSHR